MDKEKARRLYELRQQINSLKKEEEALSKEIKNEMINKEIEEIIIGKIELILKPRSKTIIDEEILKFIDNLGYGDAASKYIKESVSQYLYAKLTN